MHSDVLRRTIAGSMTLIPDEIFFSWHGGEPLLAGREFFETVVRLQQLYRRSEQKVENWIQTNGTLLDRDWIDFFHRHEWKLSISLDGPCDIHDSQRSYRDGRGTFEDVMSALRLMRANGMEYSVLVVLTRNSVGRVQEIYDFLVKNDIRHFDFLPCTTHGLSDYQHNLGISAVEYANTML